MGTKQFSNTAGQSVQTQSLNVEHSLQQKFFKRGRYWFISTGHNQPIGPFADKADAQMAMMYHSLRSLWPNEKQLREFARSGR